MMSMAGANSIDALPNLFSMIVRIMSVEAEAISLSVETRPVAGSVNTVVVTGTSGIVTVASSEVITVGTDFRYLVQPLKSEVCCPPRQCLPWALLLEPPRYSLQL